MKRFVRVAILPVAALCLAGCVSPDPMGDPAVTPDWVRERIVNDVVGRKAPPSVPTTQLTAADTAELDRNAARVLSQRDRQLEQFERDNEAGRVGVDDFVSTGRTQTTPPE